jgi:hypothetical protein
VEIDWDEESITWMIATRKYTATFAEFATACHINFERSAPISVDTRRGFYKPN